MNFKHTATQLKLKSNEIHDLEAEKSTILISKTPKKTNENNSDTSARVLHLKIKFVQPLGSSTCCFYFEYKHYSGWHTIYFSVSPVFEYQKYR